MQINKNATFLSVEPKVSKKGNDYNVVACMVGTEPITLMAEGDFSTCVFGDLIDLSLELNLMYKSLKILGFKKYSDLKK